MEKIILNVETREEKGKTQVKKIRKQGMVPAVCYKDGKEAFSLKIVTKDLYTILHTRAGENVLITLNVANAKKAAEKTVMIKEIQREPMNGDIIHVDFSEISLTKKIEVKVPVEITGEAKEIVREGGIIEHIVWEVEVECLPTNIPDKIVVDISGMKIGDAVHLKDLKVGEDICPLGEPDMVVLVGKPPAKEEVVEAVPGAEGLEEPEVIAKGKKPEEGEEEAEEGAAPAKPAKEEKK